MGIGIVGQGELPKKEQVMKKGNEPAEPDCAQTTDYSDEQGKPCKNERADGLAGNGCVFHCYAE